MKSEEKNEDQYSESDFLVEEERKETPDGSQKIVLRREISPTLGRAGVYFTLFKGLIGIGILFLPRAFSRAGWAISIVAFLLCAFFTIEGMSRLMVSHEAIGGSYSRLSKKSLGTAGKILTEVCIFLTQVTCVIGYAGYILVSINRISEALGYAIPYYAIGIGMTLVFAPLVSIKDLTLFASFHIAADILIFIVCIYIEVYSIVTFATDGVKKSVAATQSFFTSMQIFGVATGAFEICATLIPIRKQAAPNAFTESVQRTAIISASILYFTLGLFGYLAFGYEVKGPITLSLNQHNTEVKVIELAYVLVLIPTSILQIYPVIQICELYGAKNIQSSCRRELVRILIRIGLIAATIWIAVGIGERFDKGFAIMGGLAMAPLSYIFPGLIHLVLVAETTLDRTRDIILIIFGGFCFVIVTLVNIAGIAMNF